jgi:hypothetical protein
VGHGGLSELFRVLMSVVLIWAVRTMSSVASNKSSYAHSDCLMSQGHLIAAEWQSDQFEKITRWPNVVAIPQVIHFGLKSFETLCFMFCLPICAFSAIISAVISFFWPTLLNSFLQPFLFHILDRLHLATPVGLR